VKNECIYTSSPHLCLYVVHRDSFTFFSLSNLFPISLFLKCPVVSCVQIMECANVLVTQRKKMEFFTVGLAQDLNHLLLLIDGQQHNSLAVPEMNLVTACSSLAALINYLEVRY